MHADEGTLRSGVEVATMMRSISFGSRPAEAIAFSPARAARSDVYSSGSAMRRWRIPRVFTTHSGEVGRSPTISSFVRILAGTYEPVDLMETLSNRLFRIVMVPPSSNGRLSFTKRGLVRRGPQTPALLLPPEISSSVLWAALRMSRYSMGRAPPSGLPLSHSSPKGTSLSLCSSQ